MPIYEYRCDRCGHSLEVLRKVSDQPLQDCPACGQPALRKLISAAGFRLKGSGWYETDFKSSQKKSNLHEGESAAAKESGAAKESSASGAKPAAAASSDPPAAS